MGSCSVPGTSSARPALRHTHAPRRALSTPACRSRLEARPGACGLSLGAAPLAPRPFGREARCVLAPRGFRPAVSAAASRGRPAPRRAAFALLLRDASARRRLIGRTGARRRDRSSSVSRGARRTAPLSRPASRGAARPLRRAQCASGRLLLARSAAANAPPASPDPRGIGALRRRSRDARGSRSLALYEVRAHRRRARGPVRLRPMMRLSRPPRCRRGFLCGVETLVEPRSVLRSRARLHLYQTALRRPVLGRRDAMPRSGRAFCSASANFREAHQSGPNSHTARAITMPARARCGPIAAASPPR